MKEWIIFSYEWITILKFQSSSVGPTSVPIIRSKKLEMHCYENVVEKNYPISDSYPLISMKKKEWHHLISLLIRPQPFFTLSLSKKSNNNFPVVQFNNLFGEKWVGIYVFNGDTWGPITINN